MKKFGRAKRKHLFLATTMLRGRVVRDENDGTGTTPDFEVGPGFAAAADSQASDDNRAPEQRGGGATHEIPDDEGGDNSEGNGDEDSQNDEGQSGTDEEGKSRPKRKTAEYIRETKKQLRETKALLTQEQQARIELEQRLVALENGGLPKNQNSSNSDPTSGKPDPSDTAKYPLGVLDDGYVVDMIEWAADQKVKAALSKIDQTNKASEAKQLQLAQAAEIQKKVDALAERGSAKFDDYDEVVVEAAKNGEYDLTETTFTAAAEAEHGDEILYALANDPVEAARVAKLSTVQQVKYVLEKDAEISGKKPKARKVPQAGAPPETTPRGRGASSPIRPDTDNLDDFRKIFYKR